MRLRDRRVHHSSKYPARPSQVLQRGLAASLVFVLIGTSSVLAKNVSGSQATQAGATLTIAAAATPTTLDPEFSSSPQDREIDVAVYDRFTKFKIVSKGGIRQADLSSRPQPLLATSWRVSNGGRRYTFTLRKGVLSYFGHELTAKDVVWSWDRVFAQQSQGLFPLNVSSVAAHSYKALGKYKLQVNLLNPNPLLPIVLATPVPGGVIYDSTEVKKHVSPGDKWGRKWLAAHTASFGPYHAIEFTPGQQAVFVANPHYFGPKPKIKKVIYKEIPDPATRFTLIRTGQVDVAEDLNAVQRRSLKGQSGIHVIDVPGNLFIAFGVNNSIAPFTDRRVRQAIAYAMPVRDIIQTVFFNDPTVRQFKGYVADTFPGYPNAWQYQPPNLAKARNLLKAAGKKSIRFELSYTTTYPEHEKIAQIIRTGLAKINVNVILNKLTPAKYQEQYYKHLAQSVLVQDAAFVADSAYPLYLYFGAGKGAVGNWINYRNAPVQRLIARALGTPNLKLRMSLAVRADHSIIGDTPWPMLLGIGFHVAVRSNVHGFAWRPHNLIHFYDLSKR